MAATSPLMALDQRLRGKILGHCLPSLIFTTQKGVGFPKHLLPELPRLRIELDTFVSLIHVNYQLYDETCTFMECSTIMVLFPDVFEVGFVLRNRQVSKLQSKFVPHVWWKIGFMDVVPRETGQLDVEVRFQVDKCLAILSMSPEELDRSEEVHIDRLDFFWGNVLQSHRHKGRVRFKLSRKMNKVIEAAMNVEIFKVNKHDYSVFMAAAETAFKSSVLNAAWPSAKESWEGRIQRLLRWQGPRGGY